MHPDTPDFGWSFIKMVGALIIVLICLGLVLRLIRRLNHNRVVASGAIQLVGGVPLGQRRSLLLVRMGKRLHILGSTDHSITLLQTIDDAEEIRSILGNFSSSPTPLFSNFLRQLITNKSPRG